MADARGRELRVDIVSTTDQFDTREPVSDLERLGDTAHDTERPLERLGETSRDTSRRVGQDFDRMGDDARAGSRRIEQGTDRARTNIGDMGDEAGSTAREMASSFTGSAANIGDALQDVAVNAPSVFGPIGTAVGVALASGIGFFRGKLEQIKADAEEIVATIIEAGGSITEADITDKIQQLAKEGKLGDIRKQADALGLSYRDLARAHAGDADALERLNEQVAELRDNQPPMIDETGNVSAAFTHWQGQTGAAELALKDLNARQELVNDALSALAQASTDAGSTVQTQIGQMGAAWDDLRILSGQPITFTPRLNSGKFYADLAAVRRTYDAAVAAGADNVAVRASQRYKP